MKLKDVEPHLKRIDQRLETIEQILPTLPTRNEMQTAVKEEGERTRRYFDIVAESLRDDIRLIAEYQIGVEQRLGQRISDVATDVARLDQRRS